MVILGFVGEALVHRKAEMFQGYEGLGNILWLNTMKDIPIHREENDSAVVDGGENLTDDNSGPEIDNGTENQSPEEIRLDDS